MNKSGLLSLLLLVAVILALFYLPYIEFQNAEDKVRQDNQLIDHLRDMDILLNLIFMTLLYPIVLIIESTVWHNRKRVWKRLIFILQGGLILVGGFYVWFIMSFNIFTGPYDYLISFYLILVYLAIGVIWNVLLGIPYFDDTTLISGAFKRLSLKRNGEVE